MEKNGAISFVAEGYSMWPIIKHRVNSVVIETKKDRLTCLTLVFIKGKTASLFCIGLLKFYLMGVLQCADPKLLAEQIAHIMRGEMTYLSQFVKRNAAVEL